MWHRKFNLDDNVMVTSDIHRSHTNIVEGVSRWSDKSGCRYYSSVESMNAEIEQSFLSLPNNCTLILLGDLQFMSHKLLPEFVEIMRSRAKELIVLWGNHDGQLYKYKDLFDWSGHYLEMIVGSRLWCLMHYPLASWNSMQNGSYMISGHTHGSLERFGKSIDMDWYLYKKPLSLREIDNILKDKPVESFCHHKPGHDKLEKI